MISAAQDQNEAALRILEGALADAAVELFAKRTEVAAVDALRDALAGARVVRTYGPDAVVCYDYWANAGATLQPHLAGVVVETPAIPWHYAAGVPLTFDGVNFAEELCWVRLRLAEIEGEIRAGLYDADIDTIAVEGETSAFSGIREVVVQASTPAAALLLIRNGDRPDASKALILGAEIVAAPRPASMTPDAPSSPPSSAAASVDPPMRKGLQETRAVIDWLARHEALVDRWLPRLQRHVLPAAARAAAWWRGHFTTPRTVWGVTPILTLPLLAECDRRLGLRSESLVYNVYYTANRFDVDLSPLMAWVLRAHAGWYDQVQNLVLQWALLRYDAFHYFCDRGLSPSIRLGLNEAELVAIRSVGGRLYTYGYGADVRTRSKTMALGPHNLCVDCPAPRKLCICDDERGVENMKLISEFAAAKASMGDMLAYTPDARDLHYWPLDLNRIAYVGTQPYAQDRPLRVAHAPNHPYFKGTYHLVEAIERLQREGRPIELVRLQGVTNAEVLRLFATVDVVADQFIAGFHGYTALEAMAVGKPVLCFLRDRDMAIDADACPMINVWPESLHQILSDCIDGRFDLEDLGRRGRAYVERFYSIDAVAARLGRMYLDTARFPKRISKRISGRISALEAALPPPPVATPPVPWSLVPLARLDRTRTAEPLASAA